MAIMVPDSCPSKASQGEKRLFRLFQNVLPDNFHVWYEPVVKGRYPDFILLSDTFGMVVLECKGWFAKHIQKVTDTHVERVVTGGGESRVETDPNPLRQVRDYMFPMIDLLKAHPILRNDCGPHQGKLSFPCGCGVLFTNIKRAEAKEGGWAGTFPPDQVMFRDDLDAVEVASSDREVINRFGRMFTVNFPFDPLTADQLKTIQGVLHKEVVVKVRPANAASVPAGRDVPDGSQVLDVLDHKQEQLAKSIGGGHRVFFGVAGSGKTVLLIARAKLLAAQEPGKRVLMACYNRALGTYLKASFVHDAVYKNVTVLTFHAWANQWGVRKAGAEPWDDYNHRMPGDLRRRLASLADAEKYDAILIDEAHDFEPEWFGCCVAALRVDPPADLIVAVDGAQSLYGRPKGSSWKEMGVNAVGRSTRLAVNYRNTHEILDFAWDIAQASRGEEDTETHVRVKPEHALRSGPRPVSLACRSEAEEYIAVANSVRTYRDAGVADREIAVLYPKLGGRRIHKLVRHLRRYGEVAWVTDPDSPLSKDRFMDMPGVRVCTIHSAKGLEFDGVILCALDQLPSNDSDPDSDANLLYVGLTRANTRLTVTWTGTSAFTDRVRDSGKADVAAR